jgi:hypothetical protein
VDEGYAAVEVPLFAPVVHGRAKSSNQHCRLQNLVLRAYILNHYPRYFNVRISVGKKTAKNIDKIIHGV